MKFFEIILFWKSIKAKIVFFLTKGEFSVDAK